MTRNILVFPFVARSPLTRVWIETGNPNQPLIGKWIAVSDRPPAPGASRQADGPAAIPLCA